MTGSGRPARLVAAAFAVLVIATGASTADATAPVPDSARTAANAAAAGSGGRPSWVSFGDSYAAGEGLEHPTRIDDDPTFALCQRALNDDGNTSTAWGAQVSWDVADRDRYAFVACTGAITDDLFPNPEERIQAGQLEQARFHGGVDTFDVVTVSMGGNNVDFAGIMYGCAGVSYTGAGTLVALGGAGWLNAPWVGCTVSEDDMKARIDALTDTATADDTPACDDLGQTGDAGSHWDDDGLEKGKITIPEFYDVLGRCVANPGGAVLVMGYPQMIEESGRWQLIAGNRIRRADAGKLRGATAHLNFRLREAVEWADSRSAARFVFLDPTHFWEGERYDGQAPDDGDRFDRGKRHALCGGGADWLNGLTLGTEGDGALRPQRSFHPNQSGHNAMATAAERLDYARKPVELSDGQLMALANCTAPCAVTGRLAYPHPALGDLTIVTFGPQATPDDQYPTTCDHELVFAVDRWGQVVWDPNWVADGVCPLYLHAPADGGAGPVDGEGRVFLDWNPGRYNGVTVLTPTGDGFDHLDTAPIGDPGYAVRFYSAVVVDVDDDGVNEIELTVNTCHFTCAGGPNWLTVFTWTGDDMTPRPETDHWCAHTSVYDDTPAFVAELLDVTITGTSCHDVVWSDERNDPGAAPLAERFVETAIAQGHPSAVSVDGWACTIDEPGRVEGARFSCRSRSAAVTFTRWFTQHPDTPGCANPIGDRIDDDCRSYPGTDTSYGPDQ